MSTDFIKFGRLSEEAQAAAIQWRKTLHIEPVMVTPRAGPDMGKAKGVYHLQLGTQHTVLTEREFAELLAHLETARARIKKWEGR